MDGWIDGLIDKQMDGWIDGLIDKQMDGWIDGLNKLKFNYRDTTVDG